MTPLSAELRTELERAILAARQAAETACAAALVVLGVEAEKVPGHLDPEQRQLRVALRAKRRQLGGDEQLIADCAYEQWHRMLFARFLAENGLLRHPTHEVAVSIADCEEIARERGGNDPWPVAASFAAEMLPGIFRDDDPALELSLAPEHQQELEGTLTGLPSAVFTSDDALGWVYQYWQSKKKDEVNRSERKIGGSDIAPVTQLFTEHYMVRFLLENSLGAWWASRDPESTLVQGFEYLRFDDEGHPAGGAFEDWPSSLGEIKIIDPCCGSGHFLVTAFDMMRRMRMEEEGLSAAEAGDAVIRDNVHGLELDPRCTQIATFAVAIAAWKSGGYREIPLPNIACSGISAAGNLDDWRALAEGDARMEESLERLHGLFRDAGDLGSLINPRREIGDDLLAAEFNEVAPLLEQALRGESESDPAAGVFGAAAAGAGRAAALLAGEYTLVVTNPPFLGRARQDETLRSYAEKNYSDGKADLATSFVERCLSFCWAGGMAALVTPQSWLSLSSYELIRVNLLSTADWGFVARLGPGAFGAITGQVVTVALVRLSRSAPHPESEFLGVDVTTAKGPDAKARELRECEIRAFSQAAQLSHPDARIILGDRLEGPELSHRAVTAQGIKTGDDPRYRRFIWEVARPADAGWRYFQRAPDGDAAWDGLDQLVDWRADGRDMARRQGVGVWGARGAAVGVMSRLPVSLYSGEAFDSALSPVIPLDDAHLPALYCYLIDDAYVREVRNLETRLAVTNATLTKVPFDLEYWQDVAEKRYPKGLPAPRSDDPTQWLFNGHPAGSEAPLHVALARLLGYRWPRQTGSEFRDCPALGPDGLEDLADEDGVVCLPAILKEQPADGRLRSLLARAYEAEWSPAKEADLLSATGNAGTSLADWLRFAFFDQHCQLFHQRPLIWQVWDGHRDGFSALVNYHQLDRARLELLTYTYLGNWIERQRAAQDAGEAGAEARLIAANGLQEKLRLILEGEAPYDIFVRWKPVEEQPIGWEPDFNDGVRLNIRPFVEAGVLRKAPKIKWGKDRGKDRTDAPWFEAFDGSRINDHHLTLAEKRAAR